MTARYFGLIVLSMWILSSNVQAVTADQIQKQHQQVLQKEIATQQQIDRWSSARQALVNELLDLKTQLEWNRYQNKKFEQYLDHKQNTLVDLKRRKEQMSMLRMELEPFLDSRIEELQASVKTDLPFLPVERGERLTFLTQSLSDPDLALSEKLRRVLEALQVEADYGNTVEVTEETRELGGQPTMVQVLRLGRIGLYYLTLDGEQAGWWNPAEQQWVSLDKNDVQTVQTTMDVVHQKRAAVLIDLPLPAMMPATKEGAQ